VNHPPLPDQGQPLVGIVLTTAAFASSLL